MAPANLIIIMADEHNPKVMGCSGHPLVKTPNLDKLAASGTRFTNAYTNSPLCVPARASFATGQYVHKIGYWDTAHPYEGSVKSWGHRLQEKGHRVDSIGKLHYRSQDDPAGFDEQIIPMHVAEGIGDVPGAIREGEIPPKISCQKIAAKVGPGESSYAAYDLNVTKKSCEWLENAASGGEQAPWVLFVSLVCPHYPLIAPAEFFEMYPLEDVPAPAEVPKKNPDNHPWVQALRNYWVFDDYMTEESRRIGVAAYFGLCSFQDHNVGRIMKVVEDNNLAANTRIVYTSDHGEILGKRGMWGKSTLYDEAAAIPMIVSGPEIAKNKVSSTPVTLVDIYQTVLENAGVSLNEEETDFPGKSLFKIANAADDPDRLAFCEYHAAGAPTGAYMLRRGKYKYIHYVDYMPELFDLEADPEELINLSEDADQKALVAEFEKILFSMLDPEGVDKRAKADQAALIERHGGREAVLNKGSYGPTPAPGEKIVFIEHPEDVR
jgi:choline-sulfatase